MKTTIDIEDRVHLLAKKYGINISGTARRAITRSVEMAEQDERILEKTRKEIKNYRATLLPFYDNEILQNTGEEQ